MALRLGSDHEDFRRLFEERKDEVYRFLYRLSRNTHDAEDLLQETFSRLWRKREQFRGDGSVAGYLRRIAYRTFLNARVRIERARAAAPLAHEPADAAEGPGERAARADLLARVRAEVDALPDGWREPFILFRYEGLSRAEIARVMDLTPKAVEMRLYKALKRIEERVGAKEARRRA